MSISTDTRRAPLVVKLRERGRQAGPARSTEETLLLTDPRDAELAVMRHPDYRGRCGVHLDVTGVAMSREYARRLLYWAMSTAWPRGVLWTGAEAGTAALLSQEWRDGRYRAGLYSGL